MQPTAGPGEPDGGQTEPEDETEPEPGDKQPAYSRRSLYLLLTPIVVLTALAYVGDALSPTLAVTHPVWLILLNTRKRYLALVATKIDPVTFFAVGLIRQIMVDPLYFILGRRYGDAGVRWLERKLGEGASGVTVFEGWFQKAAYPMVAIAPNAIISVLAGASKMKAGVFLALNLGGTVVTLIILRIFGDVFSSPLDGVLDFLRRYQWPLTAVSIVLVVLQVTLSRKAGRSELESVSKMERELEQARRAESGEDDKGDRP